MFNTISDKFFIPLASPNKQIYWEGICKLFGIMNHQLSFGIERDVLVEELQYYFEQEHAIEIEAEDIIGKSSRDKANWMLRRLEYYGWIEIETDKSINTGKLPSISYMKGVDLVTEGILTLTKTVEYLEKGIPEKDAAGKLMNFLLDKRMVKKYH